MKFISLNFYIALVLTFLICSIESAEICRLKCSQDKLTNVCGRSGNICKRFANDCSFQVSNCKNDNAFSQVNLSECRYIDLDVERICNTGILTIGAGFGHHSILNPGAKKFTPKIIKI